MKPSFYNQSLLIGLSLLSLHFVSGQEDDLESQAASVLNDPRTHNILRSLKENPEAVADAVEQDADAAVRAATELFMSTQREEGEVPATRGGTEAMKDRAIDTLTRMIPEVTGSEGAATRPAPITTLVSATPVVAQPSVNPETTANTTLAEPAPSPPVAPDPVGSAALPQPIVESAPDLPPTIPDIPDTPALSSGNIPAPQPLQPKYDTRASANQAPPPGMDAMEITSLEALMNQNSGVLTFIGRVTIKHPQFELKSDKLELFMPEGGMASGSSENSEAFTRAIASGGMVEIRYQAVDGTVIAFARRADFDNVTKDVVLSGGPPYMQNGDSWVKTNSEDTQIVLRSNGQHEIKGSQPHTIKIPVAAGAVNPTLAVPIPGR
ncbi:MAG: LptA/OstA family protein [Verrucomicrobiota bacterium]